MDRRDHGYGTDPARPNRSHDPRRHENMDRRDHVNGTGRGKPFPRGPISPGFTNGNRSPIPIRQPNHFGRDRRMGGRPSVKFVGVEDYPSDLSDCEHFNSMADPVEVQDLGEQLEETESLN